ncbi:hypothetical protein ACHAW5_007818 [Stephanodiscus triporus]|uniref:Calcium uniporter protein n=1 Tax=Stephanodiscus triporus TaxID=2934178 RepID=A0ABD3NPY4_9STRA
MVAATARIAAALATILATQGGAGGPLPLVASAFTAAPSRLSPIARRRRSHLYAGEGFGDRRPKTTTTTTTPPSSSSSKQKSSAVETPVSLVASPSPPPSAGEGEEGEGEGGEESAGSELLRRLRSRDAERRDAELRRLRDLMEADALLAEDAGAAVIPERVARRMGRRMLPFVGVPLFGSLASFVGFWYLATYKDVEFQPAIVATTSFVFLAIGLLGITYSLLSASWDDDREGSGLGVDEFQKNVGSLREGLSRTRENALLREKMAGLSEEEIQRAIDGQNKREKAKNKKDAWME